MNSIPAHVLTFEAGETQLSYLKKKSYLPDILPSDASCHSRRTSTYSAYQYDPQNAPSYDYSITMKVGDDGLDLSLEDYYRATSPDLLHTPEKAFPRHGDCRYITEENQRLTFTSVRGWSNFRMFLPSLHFLILRLVVSLIHFFFE